MVLEKNRKIILITILVKNVEVELYLVDRSNLLVVNRNYNWGIMRLKMYS